MLWLIICPSKVLLEEVLADEFTEEIEEVYYQKNFSQFLAEIQRKNNADLFGQKKVIVLHGIENLKDKELETLVWYLQECKKKIVLVLRKERVFLKNLLRKYQLSYQEKVFPIPKGKELKQFLDRTLAKYQLKLKPSFLAVLQENYREDFDLLMQELRKLSFVRKDFNQEMLVNLLRLQANIFVMLKALVQKNYLLFVRHFYKYLQQTKNKEDLLKLISFFANSLWKISQYKFNPQAKLKGNPYYLSELKALARQISFSDLKIILQAFSFAERKLKKFHLRMEDFPRELIAQILLLEKHSRKESFSLRDRLLDTT